MNHIYIFITILLTVYGQVVIKWQTQLAGALPLGNIDRIQYIIKLLINPWMISGFVGAFLAAISWIVVVTKFDLSYAYPFTSLAFVLVVFLSAAFFNEPVTWYRVIGLTAIVAGIVISSQK